MDDIADVVDFLKEESGEVTYDESISNEIANTKVGGSGGGASSAEPEYDDYFVDAGKFIIGKDKASIGMLQRVNSSMLISTFRGFVPSSGPTTPASES